MGMFNILITKCSPIRINPVSRIGKGKNFEVIMKTSPDSYIYSFSHLNSIQIRRYRSMGWIILVGDEIPEPNYDYF